MRKILIYCDRCGTQIKLETGSEMQFSGIEVTFSRRQMGSIPTYNKFELCVSCGSETKKFIEELKNATP